MTICSRPASLCAGRPATSLRSQSSSSSMAACCFSLRIGATGALSCSIDQAIATLSNLSRELLPNITSLLARVRPDGRTASSTFPSAATIFCVIEDSNNAYELEREIYFGDHAELIPADIE